MLTNTQNSTIKMAYIIPQRSLPISSELAVPSPLAVARVEMVPRSLAVAGVEVVPRALPEAALEVVPGAFVGQMLTCVSKKITFSRFF